MWSHASAVESWFPLLLDTMLLLSAHPSLTLAHAANSVWLAFLKHEHASKLPHVLAVLPQNCMSAAPLVTWAYVERWTSAALDKVGACPPHVELHDPLYIEWEALSQVRCSSTYMVLDVVLSRLVQAEPRPSVVEGLQLLRRCVASNPPAPLVLSLLLSFISALFVFLSCANSQLADKIFAALVYDGDRSSRAVKNVRRHAAGLLVKLASKVCLVVGAAAMSLGRELFAVPGLAEYIARSLLAQAQLPDHWLRPLVRNTLRALMLHCPPAHYSDVALPLLDHVAPFMVNHLSQRWEYITSLYESGKLEEEVGSESQEVCLVVGAAAMSLGRELFAVPGLAEYIARSLLAQAQLPDHWLRPLVRNTLRALMLHCPPAHYSDVAIPDADPHDLQRLDDKLSAPVTKPSKIDKKEVFILDLPSMHAPKARPPSAVDAPEGAGLDKLFATTPT
ncbi:Chromosome region maintenance protein 5/exportin [Operophtera brumata]|uniref:Chromosome region maintenance protein 5/exportin n=1 Tax=Operophtera brumata TaxID=104452 RepID=A0A0L7LG54_OPEBR|nr:Chromosome region maintenance protein 5/exportin [Operophtera brumata]